MPELRSTNIQYGDETVSYLSSAQEQMRFDAEKVIPATISVDAQGNKYINSALTLV